MDNNMKEPAMGKIKAAMFDQESLAVLGLIRQRSAYQDMAFLLQKALEAIRDMTPESIGEPDDEWGRVMCYHEQKRAARNALKAIQKENENGSI